MCRSHAFIKHFISSERSATFFPLPIFNGSFLKLCMLSCRCNFVYDSMGNLYKKTCGQTEVQYIIDPFGSPGADIVGKVKDVSRFSDNK